MANAALPDSADCRHANRHRPAIGVAGALAMLDAFSSVRGPPGEF